MCTETKRKRSPTQELLEVLINRLDRIDERLERIEAAQDVTARVYHSHGSAIERLEKRCTAVLVDRCPLLNGKEDEGETGEP